MRNFMIDSLSMPGIGNSTKELVNQGIWFLFKVNDNTQPKATYVLIIEGSSYFLSETGAVLRKEQERPDGNIMAESVYFSDLPQPQALSNLQIA